uniref:Pyrin domain-containing protein n=1 Tax=Erpetoichthys calabaricus TaxID=27687 RepID=A0A8C4TAJ6_ERPCA
MEPSITDMILKHLEELGEQDFKRFREKLREHKVHGLKIPWSVLEKADYYDTVNNIVRCFDDNAVVESVKILEHIGNRNVAEKLRAEHKGKEMPLLIYVIYSTYTNWINQNSGSKRKKLILAGPRLSKT